MQYKHTNTLSVPERYNPYMHRHIPIYVRKPMRITAGMFITSTDNRHQVLDVVV